MEQDYIDQIFQSQGQQLQSNKFYSKAISKNKEQAISHTIKQTKLSQIETKTIDVNDLNKDTGMNGNKKYFSSYDQNVIKDKIQKIRSKNIIQDSHRSRYQTLGNEDESDFNMPSSIKKRPGGESMNIVQKFSLHRSIKQQNTVFINKKLVSLSNKGSQLQPAFNQTNSIDQILYHTLSELQQMSNDDINRLNNKAKKIIFRLSQNLSNRINIKIRKQENKNKNAVQTKKNPQKIIQLLQSFITNNKFTIQSIEKDNYKLKGKEGEFRQEQYEIMLDKEVDRLRDAIKDQNRKITQLRKYIKTEGNRISQSNGENGNNGKRIIFLTTNIIQNRIEQEKNQIKLSKIDQKYSWLTKLTQIKQIYSSKLQKQIAQKYSTLCINPEANSRYSQLKEKKLKFEILKQNLQNINNKNVIHIQNQIRKTKIECKRYDQFIANTKQKLLMIKYDDANILNRIKKGINSSQVVTGQLLKTSQNVIQNSLLSNSLKDSRNYKIKFERKDLNQIRQTDEGEHNSKYRQLWEEKDANQYEVDDNQFMQFSPNNIESPDVYPYKKILNLRTGASTSVSNLH